MIKKVKFTLYLQEEVLRNVKKQAIDEGVNFSEWIESAIKLALEYGIKGNIGNEERL